MAHWNEEQSEIDEEAVMALARGTVISWQTRVKKSKLKSCLFLGT